MLIQIKSYLISLNYEFITIMYIYPVPDCINKSENLNEHFMHNYLWEYDICSFNSVFTLTIILKWRDQRTQMHPRRQGNK